MSIKTWCFDLRLSQLVALEFLLGHGMFTPFSSSQFILFITSPLFFDSCQPYADKTPSADSLCGSKINI